MTFLGETGEAAEKSKEETLSSFDLVDGVIYNENNHCSLLKEYR